MRNKLWFLTIISLLAACGSKQGASSAGTAESQVVERAAAGSFSADSAYSFVKAQTDLGPRVPNTEAHRRAGDWMVGKLKEYGAKVTEQRADLRAFDGTTLHARNIFGQINPEATERTLIMAHYDSRPWADEDPDPSRRREPVMGANDGASGVAVALEILRQLQQLGTSKGVDILLSDAEDWGTEGDDESWALGTRYFVEHPVVEGYYPTRVILLDMVGGKEAVFPQEIFSVQADPNLVREIWSTAAQIGYGHLFPSQTGGAVTDDHVEFIKAGIPAVDIIEYHRGRGFDSNWHTTGDTLDKISPSTLKAVGDVVVTVIAR